jgi:sporulation protein YlmC with PRC-barrel domain
MKIRTQHLPIASAVCALLWTGTLSAQQIQPPGMGYQAGSQQQQMMQGMQRQPGQGMGEQQGMQRPHGQGMGQQQGMQQPGQGQSLAKQLPDKYKLSNWIGKDVKSSDGDNLGTVKELVMDDYGIVRYAVIESDKLGPERQGNLVAVPMGHFKYPLTRQDHLVFDASPQQIQGAPAFSQSAWPNMGDPNFSSVIITYWLPEDAAAQMEGEGKTLGQSAQAGQQDRQGEQQASGQPEQQGQQDVTSGVFDPNRDMVYLSREATEMFKRLDTNNDGVIDKEEAQQNDRLADRFGEIDSYSNERITRSEFAMFELEESGQQQGDSKQQSRDQEQGKSDQDKSSK